MVNSVTEHHNWLCLWVLSLEANLQPSLALFALSSAFLAISHHMSPSLVASLAHVWFACVPLLNTRQRSMPVFAHPVPSAALGSQRAQPSLSRPSCWCSYCRQQVTVALSPGRVAYRQAPMPPHRGFRAPVMFLPVLGSRLFLLSHVPCEYMAPRLAWVDPPVSTMALPSILAQALVFASWPRYSFLFCRPSFPAGVPHATGN
jgi:hypothetical protein